MKKNLLIAFSIFICVGIALWPDTHAHSNTGAAPVGYTGSPFEFSGRTCGTGSGCHGGGSTLQNNWITTDIPACGYTPGQTYTINVFVTSPGRTKFGFSLSPQFDGGATAGTLIAGSQTQLQSSGRYITHTSAGTAQSSANSRTWTFQWTAPASGTVNFYAAMNATNSGGNTTGDLIFNGSLTVNPATALSLTNSGNNVFCADNPVTLSSNFATGNQWTINGLSAGSGQTIQANAGGIYELINTQGSCIQNQSITLTAIAGPPVLGDIQVGAEGTELCEGETVTLSLGGSNLVWQPGGETSNSIVVSGSGSYSVSSTNICGTAQTEPVVVNVTDIPETPSIFINDNGQLQASVDADFYTWFVDGLEIEEQTDSVILATQAGQYEVVAINGLFCQSPVSAPFDFEPTRVNLVEESWKVFPQPATDWVCLASNKLPQYEFVEISDLQGRVLERIAIQQQTQIVWNAVVPSGMYLFRVGPHTIKVLR
jgi:hypothetical protein